MARGPRAALPLPEPFKRRDNPGNRNTEAGQTPNGIGYTEKSDCQHSSEDAGHKGQHPPKHYESPGASVASHSRLQSRDITSQGL
jgi:hypothetical protein